jgi:sirohydrochlorin ferrochelatase
MSGTRQDSRPGPATRGALLIAAHGDCGGEGNNVLANELARRIRKARCYDEVAVGFMRGGPTIEEAMSQICSEVVRVFPLFMSDGYYVRDAIPRRLAIKNGRDVFGHRVVIDRPLGLYPGLPILLSGAARRFIQTRGLSATQVTLLLVAHGSGKSEDSARIARAIGEDISRAQFFSEVKVAFLEEAPLFPDVLKHCRRPVVVLGLFAGNGMHADEDVRNMVKELSDPSVVVIEQLGGYADVIELIVSSIC